MTQKKNDTKVGNSERLARFEAVLATINKDKKFETEHGDPVVSLMGDAPQKVETISTGSLVLDSILGGGLAKGRVIEIFGQESSGKTSIALTAVGNVQKNDGTAMFIDLEHALDPRYASKLGVDIPNLAISQPDNAEQALDLLTWVTDSGAADIIVVDSLAALVPKVEIEGDMDDQTIGVVARLLSKVLRKLVGMAHRTGTTVILINQLRDHIGGFSPFGTPQITTGGKATKFYASQRLEVKRTEQVKEGKELIGNKIRLTVVKNKIAPPFQKGETVLTFGHGIHQQAEMIEVGEKYGVIDKPNARSYFEAETGERIGTSKANAIETLETDEEMFARLQAALRSILIGDVDGSAEIQQDEDDEDMLDENGLVEGENESDDEE